jgi:hypothetical protein
MLKLIHKGVNAHAQKKSGQLFTRTFIFKFIYTCLI